MTKKVDVLIITAAEGEDDAVRQVDDGALGAWEETPGPDGYGFKVWFRDYRAKDGRPLRFALTRAHSQRTDAAGNAAARLTDAYKPQCLAMCGVCAGNPNNGTRLGDVIVADRLYKYDEGEHVNENGKSFYYADILTYQLDAQWKQHAEHYKVPPDTPWLQERPRPRDLQGLWVMREILEGRNPLTAQEKALHCADWSPVIDLLEKEKWITLTNGSATLTEAGKAHVQHTLFRNGDRLPIQEPWRVYVGPIGTGNDLQRDPDIWDRLRTGQQYIRGLEMEASIIGQTAHVQRVPYMMVAKGVLDYAEPGRNQGFRAFAARASAEVLISLLRENLDPSGKSPSDILSPNILPPPDATNPATLLNARYGVVPFFDAARQIELAELDRWCVDDKPTSVRLFLGPGGAGKTRLFIEWARRMRQQGWVAGFAPDPLSAEDADVLVASPEPTLVVIDYAESRPALLDLLKRVAARKAPAKLRVALVAREAADWWLSLLQMDESVRHLLQHHEPMPLVPVPLEHNLRTQTWERARDTYAAALGKQPPATPPDLTDRRFERVLYLHMSALATVEGRPATADSLLDEILAHEKQFWLKRFNANFAEDAAGADFIGRTARTVAAVTLHGGLPAIEDAEALNKRIAGPDEKHFLPFLRSLYPGREKDAQAGYLAGLEPDLLGEALVIEVMSNGNTRRDYLDRVFEGADKPALQNGFTVLGRIALRHANAVEWIKRVLEKDISGRAEAAFDAAMTLGRETAFSPLGRVLALGLVKEGTPALAAVLAERIPYPTCSLCEAATWSLKTLLNAIPTTVPEEEALSVRALLLGNLSNRLSALGRREEALDAARVALDLFRHLGQSRPDAVLPYLASTLNNLSNALCDLGQTEEALDAARKAVDIRRRLSQSRPDAYLPDLAMSLNNLCRMLNALGRIQEALDAARDAVELYRRLDQTGPSTFIGQLAGSLNNLGLTLSALSRHEEALSAAREAGELYRSAVQTRPDAYLPDLAMSLSNLSKMLIATAQFNEAEDAAREAVELYRRLSQTNRDAFLQNLATSLNNLSNTLNAMGRTNEALEAAHEAVELAGCLAMARPDVLARDLAMSLGTLGMCLRSAQRFGEARDVFAEGVRTLTPQFTALPKAFAPPMASLLAQYVKVSEELGVDLDYDLVLPVRAKFAELKHAAE